MQCTALPSSLVALPQGTRGKTTQQLPRNVVWDHGQARLEVPSGVVWSGLTLQRSPGLSWTEMLLGFVGKQPYLWDFLQGDGWGALLLPQSSSSCSTGRRGSPAVHPLLLLWNCCWNHCWNCPPSLGAVAVGLLPVQCHPCSDNFLWSYDFPPLPLLFIPDELLIIVH